MAYFASNPSESERDFEYPDPESAFAVYSQYQTQMSAASSRQDCYPSPSNQATYQAQNSITEHSRQTSFPNAWYEEPHLGQVTSVLPSPCTPAPSLDSALQHTKKDNGKFAPRGKTGHIVCADCGGRFTVRSSLNRHSKICRGRKKAWRPAPTQHENMKVADADNVSDLSVHPLAADERDSVSSEGVSNFTGSNSNIYDTPTKRTGSAPYNTENPTPANSPRNDASLTAESNRSPPKPHHQTEVLSSTFHTPPAPTPSSHPPNPTPSPYAPRPQAISAQSQGPQREDLSADQVFPHRQHHSASAHGVIERAQLRK